MHTMSDSSPQTPTLIVPSPVEPGQKVGVVATSGPVDRKLLDKGMEFLSGLGFKVIAGSCIHERMGYLAGSDEQRAADLNCMIQDPNVRAIFFARGGYGAMRLLDLVDCDTLREDPKLIAGMSDLTALQLSLFARCRLVTLSAPMIAGQIGNGPDELTRQSFVDAVTKPFAGRDLLSAVHDKVNVLRHGRGSGCLVGGCLSMICALLGTPHCPDFHACVLFLEDVNEPLYRVDRMLTQLKLAGILDRINGLILGHFLGPRGSHLRREVEKRAVELTENARFPIISGFPHGHALPNLTIPHGMPCHMETRPLRLTIADRYYTAAH
ncbi:MAG: LD-carboxypeptidase [Thermodesulfobacteriota bacterium]